MPIDVYPSLMPGAPIETHEWSGTVGAWLNSQGIDHLAQVTQPIIVFVNGVLLPVGEWFETSVSAGDTVDIKILPHGGVINSAINLARKLDPFLNWVMKSLDPKAQSAREDNGDGTKLETTKASANSAKFGSVVPELAGTHRRFPDYLTPPRRHFANLREQWLEFHACVGPGRYFVNGDDVKVGETPFSSLGADASYQLFEPGASIAGVSTHEHWYTAPEVGGTSSGTAGLELGVDMATTVHAPAPAYVFSGITISIPAGTGVFPVGWGPGTIISVNIGRTLTYDVTKITIPFRNVFDGDFAHLLPLSNGDRITVNGGGLSGDYLAQAVTLDTSGLGTIQLWTLPIPPSGGDPGSSSEPVESLDPGSYSLTMSRTRELTLLGASDEFVTVSGFSFPAYTGAATIAYAGGLAYGEWTSAFVACPPAETTNTIELDFFFPGGLAEVLDTGALAPRTVRSEIQYRDAAVGGAFTSVIKIYDQATLDQIGFTERLTVPAMLPEVRVRRVGATSTSTQVQDKIQWYGLKSRLPTRTSYPNWTTMSVSIRSGGKLAAQSENQVNLIATRMLPTMQPDGTWGAMAPTRDISAFAKYVSGTIGYTDDNLDISEFLRLHNVWAPRGETLDYVFDETTVKDALNTTFGAGMAELTVDDGLIKPVRDDVRTQWEQGYSPQNMTGPLRRTFRSRKIDDHDGVEVEYINDQTWVKEVVQCRLPGDQGFKVQKIRLDGVTDRTRAWRIGMRQRRVQRYRNWEYSFETELDALNSGYLSYVPLIDDIPGYGQSAILEDIESVSGGAMLHVSEPLIWQAGANHVVGYRRPDGTVAGPFAATPGIDEYSVIADIPQPWPVVTLKYEPPHVYFGTAERWTFPALVTEISPNGLERVRVSATNYSPDVYLDDNNTPPN